ncbi:MAG: hypothetical protein H8E44_45425 [Planctomycetes bacterium]|nr:hypothetical protein [Planctomycetota bacterium]
MRRFFRILIWFLVIVVVVCGTTAYLLYRGTQKVPEFYQEALATKPAPQELKKMGRQLERQAAELHNDARREGRWEAVFTAEQVNAWLAVDLLEKLPATVPEGVSDPRVKISSDLIQAACKYETDGFSSVVSLETDVYLTDEPNQVAIRIRSVRSGLVPLPFRGLLDQVADSARKNGVDLRWSQQEGDPVALIRVPTRQQQRPPRDLHIESLQVRDGEIYLAGRTETGRE